MTVWEFWQKSSLAYSKKFAGQAVFRSMKISQRLSTWRAAHRIVNYGWAGSLWQPSSTEATATAYNINEMSWLLPLPVALPTTITETVWVSWPPSQDDNNVLSL